MYISYETEGCIIADVSHVNNRGVCHCTQIVDAIGVARGGPRGPSPPPKNTKQNHNKENNKERESITWTL